VINLVHETASEVAFSFNSNFVAVFNEGLDFDFTGARNKAVNFRNGETTLIVTGDFAFGFDDFGIDEGGEGVIGFIIEIIAYQNDALVNSELRGGNGGRKFIGVGLFPFEGGFKHVSNNLVGFVSNLIHLTGFLTEARIWRSNDFFHSLYYSKKV